MVLKIDLKIFIFFVLFYLTKQIKLYATIMVLCVIHELGHVLMGLIMGLKIEKIEIMPLGLSVSFKLNVDDYNKKIKKGAILQLKKIAIAVAGPLTNLIILLIVLYTNINFKIVSNELLAYANLLIILFNLLPIYPLDGGRILKEILHILEGSIKSKIYIRKISKAVIILLTMIASIGVLYLKNIAIFFVIIYLWIIVIRENRLSNVYELEGNSEMSQHCWRISDN